jgi:hypothetical protein
MDRPPHELPTPYVEQKTNARLNDLVNSPRPWHLPVPLRVKHSGFTDLGIHAPVPTQRPPCFTLKVIGTADILTYPGSKHWFVQTVCLPDGTIPEDPFAGEPPHIRVGGGTCKGIFTFSSKGLGSMLHVDVTRAVIAGLADQVQRSEPDSRILIRLLPRYVQGSIRWFPSHRCVQLWNPI